MYSTVGKAILLVITVFGAMTFAGCDALKQSGLLDPPTESSPVEPPDMSNPKFFRHAHINLSYPANWTEQHKPDTIYVGSTGDAVVTLFVWEDPIVIELDKHMVQATEQIRQHYASSSISNGKLESTGRADIRRKISHGVREGRRHAFTIKNAEVSMDAVLEIYAIALGPRTVMVEVFSPVDEMSTHLPGLLHVLDSIDVDDSR